MSVKGEIRTSETTTFDKHVGLVEIKKIVAVNPTVEERAKLYGREVKEDEEVVYLTKTDDGYAKINIDFFYETHKPELGIKRHRISLVNKNKVSRDGSKQQFINQVGMCTYSDSEDNLPSWFTTFTDKQKNVTGPKSVRPALEGEELLMAFLISAYKLKYYLPTTDISYDYKKFFKGDVRELRADVLNEELQQPFTGLLQVETSEDGEKTYEKLWAKEFLPSGIMKNIRNGKTFAEGWVKSRWERFVKEAEGDYGPKGYFILDEVTVYNKEDDDAADEGQAPKKKLEMNSDY